MIISKKQSKIVRQQMKMIDIIKEILISEKKFTDTNYERL